MKKPRVQCILVPVDFSAASSEALAHASALAEATGASLMVLHVWEAPSVSGGRLVMVDGETKQPWSDWVESRANSEMQKFISGALEIDAKLLLRHGKPSRQILEVAEEFDADMIVMGTRGRSGLGRVLLGSVAERIVRTAPCPVLTVRSEHAEED